MLIPFKETPETREGFHCKGYRWSFQIEKDFIGFVHQYNWDGEWSDDHSVVYAIWYHGDWAWGFSHFYYDGPHCGLSVGPIRFQWYNGNCKHCLVGF